MNGGSIVLGPCTCVFQLWQSTNVPLSHCFFLGTALAIAVRLARLTRIREDSGADAENPAADNKSSKKGLQLADYAPGRAAEGQTPAVAPGAFVAAVNEVKQLCSSEHCKTLLRTGADPDGQLSKYVATVEDSSPHRMIRIDSMRPRVLNSDDSCSLSGRVLRLPLVARG